MDQDLHELRRRAFSRHGTPDDLRALAEAETRDPAGGVPGPAQAVEVVAPTPVDPVEHEDAPPPPGRRASRRAVVLAAVFGAVGGIAVGAWGSHLVFPVGDEADSSLAVFDRPAATSSAEVPAPADLFPPDSQVRYLGQVEGRFVHASRRDGVTDAEICLAVSDADGAAMGCTSEEDFRRRGIQIFSGGIGVGWGPFGEEPWTSPFGS